MFAPSKKQGRRRSIKHRQRPVIRLFAHGVILAERPEPPIQFKRRNRAMPVRQRLPHKFDGLHRRRPNFDFFRAARRQMRVIF